MQLKHLDIKRQIRFSQTYSAIDPHLYIFFSDPNHMSRQLRKQFT